MKDCNYVKNSNEPCKTCLRLITTLYRCELLKEIAKEGEIKKDLK